jgi:glycosyltransferase involved in cell wall biosynthesis
VRVLIFLNSLSLGGTEKAAAEWAHLLSTSPAVETVRVLSLSGGPRNLQIEQMGIPVHVCSNSDRISGILAELDVCDVINAHAPGYPHQGDVLGVALSKIGRKIPVVQTNVFGRLDNPSENAWTDFRLFISWTSCVQASRRAGKPLNLNFFRRQTVASYPVENPLSKTNYSYLETLARSIREANGLSPDNLLFGRFSRPEPNKWSPMMLDVFLAAHKQNPKLRLLLREPPEAVSADLVKRGLAYWHANGSSSDARPIIVMHSTSVYQDLASSQLACDVILHTSSIGESFGYGIAEPMALGRPVITHSVPWHDQAQLELVQHGKCGLIASSPQTIKNAMLRLAAEAHFRKQCGNEARRHILQLADTKKSTSRLLAALHCALDGTENPNAVSDLASARKAAENLDHHQWGNTPLESIRLHGKSASSSFLLWQKNLRTRISKRFFN